MAAHIYATDAQKAIDYLTKLHDTFGMTIWVTEFACEVRCISYLLPLVWRLIESITHSLSLEVHSVVKTRLSPS